MEPARDPATAPAPAPAPARFTWSRLLGRTARVWSRNLLAFTLVGVIVDLPVAAFDLRGPFPTDDLRAAVLLLVVLWVLRILAAAALSLGVMRSLAGERPSPREMLVTPARQLWPIFAVASAWSVLVAMGLTLFVLPGLAVLAAGFVCIPAVVAEPDLGTEPALRRSFALTAGHRFALLGVFLLLLGIEELGAWGAAVAAAGPLLRWRVAGVALEILCDALLGGLTNCSLAVAYHDLRIARGMPPPRIVAPRDDRA